jgi:uncharacterized glyoxalase superfamily protein PhnB
VKLQYSLPVKPPFEWVSLLLEETEIMFWKKEAAQKEYPDLPLTSDKPSNVIIYMYVENIDRLYEQVKDKVTVVMKLKNQFYGIREFTICDCFEIVWTFAQVKDED